MNSEQADNWLNEKFSKQYFLRTRQVIPEVLKLFSEFNIHATWATVGFLMADGREDLLNSSPSEKPSYLDNRFSSYEFINKVGVGASESSDPFHFAPSLVQLIQSTPGQEVGSHTWSHYLLNEHGQSLDQFRLDLRAAKSMANRFSIDLKSLVLPGNQVNEDYLKICKEEGFMVVRTNPTRWFWNINTKQESLAKRLFRAANDYFPSPEFNSYPLHMVRQVNNLPLLLPASRFLRPFNPKLGSLNSMRLNRIDADLKHASKMGEVYHLWWHPHNFGFYPEESLADLKMILEVYSKLESKGQIQSINMGECLQEVSGQLVF